jgi:hypothetical protein
MIMHSLVTLQKLDGRHTLSQFYPYRAKMIGNDGCMKFVEIRNWLWENYGPGLERETVWVVLYQEGTKEPKWSWWVDDRKYFIYMKDEILTHFSLKYLNT